MYIVPLRVEDAEVDRPPLVSICIVAMCAVLFFITYVVPRYPGGFTEESVEPVMGYWAERPYLVLPDRLLEMMRPQFRELYERQHREALEQPLGLEDVEGQQEELDARVTELFGLMDTSLLRRLSLVPARGLLQIGLVTHMFLHLGWMHLLGNMLFFYIVGLLLEDRWGRGFFAGFFLAGGLVAAFAQYLMDTSSPGMMLGASGAVAACMGAFTMRFPRRRIRMGYWILWIFRGTFLVSAWVWGLIWFLLELVAFRLDDGTSGIAFAAHVWGFVFGAAAAVLLRVSGLEERVLTPLVERKTVSYTRPEGIDRASDAMEKGDKAAARRQLQEVLQRDPSSVDAEVMLVKLDAAENQAQAAARAERLFSRLLVKGTDNLFDAIDELAKVLDLTMLRPVTLFRLAQSLDRAPDGLRPLAERLFATAAREPNPYAAKSLVRAALARLDAGGDAKGALEYLARLDVLPQVPEDLHGRVEELRQRIDTILGRDREVSPRFLGKDTAPEKMPPPPPPATAIPEAAGAVEAAEGVRETEAVEATEAKETDVSEVFGGPGTSMSAATETLDAAAVLKALEEAEIPEAPGAPREAEGSKATWSPGVERAKGVEAPDRRLAQVMECELGGMTGDALSLVLEGGKRMDLSFIDMVGVAVGLVPEPEPARAAPPRHVLYTDLVIAWRGPERPARVIRLKSSTLSLHNLYPGMSPPEAYGVFLQHVLDQSGATALPDAAALERGEYPHYADERAFIEATYG